MTGSFNAPTSPYGGETAIGADPMSALGAMMGAQIGENAGFGGLGLRGTGHRRRWHRRRHDRHGQPSARSVTAAARATVRATAVASATCASDAASRRDVRPAGDADVRGSLSAEVIKRVIRRHMNEVRFCYEQGLHTTRLSRVA